MHTTHGPAPRCRLAWRSALLAAAALVVSAAPAPAGPSRAGAPPTAAPYRLVDVAVPAVLAAQEAVVTADHGPAIRKAQAALASAGAALASATSRQSQDRALADQAVARVGADQHAVAADIARLAADTAARDAAAAAAAVDEAHLRAIAVELYIDPQTTTVGPSGPTLQQAQRQLDAQAMIVLGTAAVTGLLHRDAARRDAGARAVTIDVRTEADDQAALAEVTRLRDQRATILAADAAATSTAIATLASAQSAAAAATASLTAAVAALANPPGAPADGSPSIVGVAALTPAQMAGWYRSTGYEDLTSATIDQLAGWYISEGAAEGVRGDVAFAQSMVETAGFASADAVDANNYAGIGHCDSCGTGLPFPSPQLGVRAQIQLLHSFADGPLTSAQLANPLVVADLAPQSQPDKGCCQTWQSLTGKWATDPLYGHTILTVYQRMLAWALARPAA